MARWVVIPLDLAGWSIGSGWRLGATVPASRPLMTSLAADGRDLEARVERLLAWSPGGQKPVRWSFTRTASIMLLACLSRTIPVGAGTLHGSGWST